MHSDPADTAPPAARAVDPRRLLATARHDPRAAERELAALPQQQQLRLVCESKPAARPTLLALLPDPAAVISRMPAGELCFTIKAAGLRDAGWIAGGATTEQVQACLDLDAWGDEIPDRSRLDLWFHCLADGGDEVLLRAIDTVDTELVVLWLQDRIAQVSYREAIAGEGEWMPPPDAMTLDGTFYLTPQQAGDDLALPLRLFRLLAERDPLHYQRLLYAVRIELPSETEEWALQWRTGRLQDLGFPPRGETLEIYATVPTPHLERPPAQRADVTPWSPPLWVVRSPADRSATHTVLRAAAELDADEEETFLYAYLALANKVAVADRLPLGDAESIPRAMEKIARLTSRGLEDLCRRHPTSQALTWLRSASLTFLFRVGAAASAERATDPSI